MIYLLICITIIIILIIVIACGISTVKNFCYNRKLCRKCRSDANALDQYLSKITNKYFTERMLYAIKATYKNVFELIQRPEKLPSEALSLLEKFYRLDEIRQIHNRNYINNELLSSKKFFDQCVGSPLDQQQRLVCVLDEDAINVIAGAGTGKTLTLLAKIRYLVERKHIPPRQILVLSFTNKVIDELNVKCNVRSFENVDIYTFHKFGLMHSGASAAIADDSFLEDFIKGFLRKNKLTIAPDLLRFLGCYVYSDELLLQEANGDNTIYGQDIESLKAVLDGQKKIQDLHTHFQNNCHTLQAERIKSIQEMVIANFLFLHGVKYEYEREYPNPPKSWTNGYKPDFYLVDYDIYWEHFGINEKGEPPAYYTPEKQKKYINGMKSKRNLHKRRGTKLIESYSFWAKDGNFIPKIKRLLEENGVTLRLRPANECEKIWYKIIEKHNMKTLRPFEKLLIDFISVFKESFGSENSPVNLINSVRSDINIERKNIFLKIITLIYQEYQKELSIKNKIDFSDMIRLATHRISTGECKLNYKYILVDEFQDITYGKMRLLNAIVRNSYAKIICVGDDWQSIYGFTGGNVDYIINFSQYFDFSTQCKIEHTYRLSREMSKRTSTFLIKNKSQTQKNLVAVFSANKPIITVVPSEKEDYSFLKMIEYVLADISSIDKNKEIIVFLLGRNNDDKDRLYDNESKIIEKRLIKNGKTLFYYIHPKYPLIYMQFLTVHQAKGLEADYCVLLNMENRLYGFPNKLGVDPLMSLLLSQNEDFLYAEERRLFYVACTRARKRVYLLSPYKVQQISSFITELCAERLTDFLFMGSQGRICPLCGAFLQKKDGYNFWGCIRYPNCLYKEHSPEENTHSTDSPRKNTLNYKQDYEPYPYTTENIFERCMVKEQKENCVCNPEFDNIDFSYNEQLLKKKNALAVKINTKEKLEVLRSKARMNDSQSMFDLALCYSEGIQVRKSKKNALCWFRKCYEAEKDLWFPTYALEILNNLKNSNFESLPNGQYDCIKKILNEAHINYKI